MQGVLGNPAWSLGYDPQRRCPTRAIALEGKVAAPEAAALSSCRKPRGLLGSSHLVKYKAKVISSNREVNSGFGVLGWEGVRGWGF